MRASGLFCCWFRRTGRGNECQAIGSLEFALPFARTNVSDEEWAAMADVQPFHSRVQQPVDDRIGSIGVLLHVVLGGKLGPKQTSEVTARGDIADDGVSPVENDHDRSGGVASRFDNNAANPILAKVEATPDQNVGSERWVVMFEEDFDQTGDNRSRMQFRALPSFSVRNVASAERNRDRQGFG